MIRFRGLPLTLVLSAFLMGAWCESARAQQRPAGRRPTTPTVDAPAVGVDRPTPPGVEPLRTAVDRPIDIRDIRLELRADLPKKVMEGTAILKLRGLRELKHLDLDAADFKVKEVRLAADEKGAPRTVPFTHDGKKLTVVLDPPWTTGREATLCVDYRVEDPKEGLHFFGPTKDDPKAPLTVWSQGEPISNRYWFPCIDAPDERQTTEIVVTVPEGFEAISNGKLLSRKTNPDGKTVTFDWRQDKEHPSYLVTLVIGQFDVVREEWDRVPVIYYVPKGSKDKVTTTFARTRDMLDYFSKRFGIHYPWDKYAQVVAYSFGGGMENTSATTMGDILQDERSSLDRDSDGIIAHELAHQWWGDLVTCRDWSHLWLNEGFASFAEALWDENKNGPDAYEYNLYQKAHGSRRAPLAAAGIGPSSIDATRRPARCSTRTPIPRGPGCCTCCAAASARTPFGKRSSLTAATIDFRAPKPPTSAAPWSAPAAGTSNASSTTGPSGPAVRTCKSQRSIRPTLGRRACSSSRRRPASRSTSR